MSKKTRVLIVDDSRTGRALIAAALKRDPDIEISGMAGDPLEARDMIIRDEPDVITLDVEMPNMNGLQFLEKIMRLRPIPVVMVSSLTARGANSAVEALELGAFDCFPKPSGTLGLDAYRGLVPIIKLAARSGVRARLPQGVRVAGAGTGRFAAPPKTGTLDVVAIGASTGGVEALGEILPRLSEDMPPLVIAQHMPALFTSSLASRLDRLCRLKVMEAVDGMPLRPGHAYIAPGGDRHLHVRRTAAGLITSLDSGPPVSGHCPSVDELFFSVAEAVGRNALGVILTGMGGDGAEGLLRMRQAGAHTLGQSEGSCVVYGMPRVAVERGAVEQVVPLSEMAGTIASFHVYRAGVKH